MMILKILLGWSGTSILLALGHGTHHAHAPGPNPRRLLRTVQRDRIPFGELGVCPSIQKSYVLTTTAGGSSLHAPQHMTFKMISRRGS